MLLLQQSFICSTLGSNSIKQIAYLSTKTQLHWATQLNYGKLSATNADTELCANNRNVYANRTHGVCVWKMCYAWHSTDCNTKHYKHWSAMDESIGKKRKPERSKQATREGAKLAKNGELLWWWAGGVGCPMTDDSARSECPFACLLATTTMTCLMPGASYSLLGARFACLFCLSLVAWPDSVTGTAWVVALAASTTGCSVPLFPQPTYGFPIGWRCVVLCSVYSLEKSPRMRAQSRIHNNCCHTLQAALIRSMAAAHFCDTRLQAVQHTHTPHSYTNTEKNKKLQAKSHWSARHRCPRPTKRSRPVSAADKLSAKLPPPLPSSRIGFQVEPTEIPSGTVSVGLQD